jgi:hypothetical protein
MEGGFQAFMKIQSDLNKLSEWTNFLEHVDVMVGKAFAMLGFIRRLSFEFRDPYTLKSLYTSLVRPKLIL